MKEILKFNMWSILKADIEYSKLILIVAYSIGLVIIIFDIVFHTFDIDILMGMTTITYFISMWIIGSTDNKEKRDRFQTGLPNPLHQLSMARLLFVILFQAGMFVLWIALFLIKYTEDAHRIILNIFSVNVFNIIVVTLFVIYFDLGYFRTKMYRILFLVSASLVFIFLIWLSLQGHVQYPLSFGPEIQNSLTEALIYHIACIGLICFDYTIYLKRRSYLE
jgi:hypothetical protein